MYYKCKGCDVVLSPKEAGGVKLDGTPEDLCNTCLHSITDIIDLDSYDYTDTSDMRTANSGYSLGMSDGANQDDDENENFDNPDVS